MGVQRRGRAHEILNLVRGDATGATWSLESTATTLATGMMDLKGPFIQGPPGHRFIYLSWGTVDSPGAFAMFRRAKLCLDAVPDDILVTAAASGTLVGRLGLTDKKGHTLWYGPTPDDRVDRGVRSERDPGLGAALAVSEHVE